MKRTSFSLILLTAILSPIFSAQAERAIQFKPPQLGAPNARIGGGTRSIGKLLNQPQFTGTEQVQLLAASQTGLTSRATPTLYWYASSVPPYTIEITIQQGGNQPLLKKNIGIIRSAGIQAIRLADYGVTLANEKDYTWSVALVSDPAQRATDLIANATIRYETPSTALTDIAQMQATGYWYDAVAQLVESKSPQLSEFLRQENISIPTN
jgi:hypothetical protein